ncbi:hypothetical protein C8Q77DRAFT_1138989 [Trametes polyzona]|nr:hypothetical protein C8Q77DRAFT_1138989 [Trametes polyzona]
MLEAEANLFVCIVPVAWATSGPSCLRVLTGLLHANHSVIRTIPRTTAPPTAAPMIAPKGTEWLLLGIDAVLSTPPLSEFSEVVQAGGGTTVVTHFTIRVEHDIQAGKSGSLFGVIPVWCSMGSGEMHGIGDKKGGRVQGGIPAPGSLIPGRYEAGWYRHLLAMGEGHGLLLEGI